MTKKGSQTAIFKNIVPQTQIWYKLWIAKYKWPNFILLKPLHWSYGIDLLTLYEIYIENGCILINKLLQ